VFSCISNEILEYPPKIDESGDANLVCRKANGATQIRKPASQKLPIAIQLVSSEFCMRRGLPDLL